MLELMNVKKFKQRNKRRNEIENEWMKYFHDDRYIIKISVFCFPILIFFNMCDYIYLIYNILNENNIIIFINYEY